MVKLTKWDLLVLIAGLIIGSLVTFAALSYLQDDKAIAEQGKLDFTRELVQVLAQCKGLPVYNNGELVLTIGAVECMQQPETGTG